MANMDVNEFREFGKAAIDFVADYLVNIRDRYADWNLRKKKLAFRVK